MVCNTVYSKKKKNKTIKKYEMKFFHLKLPFLRAQLRLFIRQVCLVYSKMCARLIFKFHPARNNARYEKSFLFYIFATFIFARGVFSCSIH